MVRYRKALPIRVETWDKVGEAKCYDALGLAHYSLGELLEAAASFEKACAIWKAEEDPVSLIESLEALGGVFFQAGRHTDAIDAYTRHLQLVRDRDEGHADAEVLVRLGLSYASIGQFERALRALSGALNAFGASNDISGRATCLQHIGSVRGRMGQIDSGIAALPTMKYCNTLDSGIAALDSSLKLRRDIRDWQGEADCLQELGIVRESTLPSVYYCNIQVGTSFGRVACSCTSAFTRRIGHCGEIQRQVQHEHNQYAHWKDSPCDPEDQRRCTAANPSSTVFM